MLYFSLLFYVILLVLRCSSPQYKKKRLEENASDQFLTEITDKQENVNKLIKSINSNKLQFVFKIVCRKNQIR